MLEGLAQELSDVPNIESAHQVEAMNFDRPDADIQRSGNLPVGMAHGDQSRISRWRGVMCREDLDGVPFGGVGSAAVCLLLPSATPHLKLLGAV